jgi:predicted GNAT family acetyltransferase
MSKQSTQVTKSRFEIEDGGEVAYLEFETDGHGWMTLWHTEVPPALRGRGIAGELAKTALEYARDQKLKVDVICPLVAGYIEKNPEFKTLLRAE